MTLIYSSIQASPRNIYAFHDGLRETLVENQSINSNPAFDPTGRWVIYTSEESGTPALHVKDLEDGGTRALFVPSRHMQDAAVISPMGKSFIL